MKARVPQISVVFVLFPIAPAVRRRSDDAVHIFLHGGIELPQRLPVSGHFVQIHRQPEQHIAPPCHRWQLALCHRAVFSGENIFQPLCRGRGVHIMAHLFQHEIIHFCRGRDDGDRTVLFLIGSKTVQPALVKGGHLLVQHTGLAVHQHISGPACLFTLRTIGGDGHHIIALRIADILVQPLKLRVITVEDAFILFRGREQHRLKILRLCVFSSFDPDIAEAVEGKHRLIVDLVSAAEDGLPLAGTQSLKIAAVRVQHLGVVDAYLGASLFTEFYAAASGDDLPEIKDHLIFRIGNHLLHRKSPDRLYRFQCLCAQHIQRVRLTLYRRRRRPCLCKVDLFAHKQIRVQDIGLPADLCAIAGNRFLCAVRIGDLQLVQDRGLFVVCAYGSCLAVEIPAIPHQHFQRVFALLQQSGHIVGLIIQDAFIRRELWRKFPFIRAFSVDQKPVCTIAGGIHGGFFHGFGKRNRADKGQHRVLDAVRKHLVGVACKGGFDPLCLPVLPEQPGAEITVLGGAVAVIVLRLYGNTVDFPALQRTACVADKSLSAVGHDAAVPETAFLVLHRNADFCQHDILLFRLHKERKLRCGVDHR